MTDPVPHSPNLPARRDQRVIALREQGLTFEQIGYEFGVSQERARQIYHAAIEASTLTPLAPHLPERRDPRPVHDAVRDQITEDLGQRRVNRELVPRVDLLRAALDRATFNASLHWLSGAGRSSVDTKRRYADDLLDFAAWAADHFGVWPVPLLDILDFDSVTVWTVYARSQGKAVRSQRRILAVVSSLFGDAAPRGWAHGNPVSFKHHAPKVGKSDNSRPAGATRVLPSEDAAKMRVACDTDEEHLVFGLLLDLALRESEVVNLHVENIDRNTSPAVLNFQRKGGQWRKRELPSKLLQHLDAHIAGRTEGPLLLDPKTGGPRNRHQIIDLTRRLARRAEIPHPSSVTPHVLRAVAITDLLNAGEPLQDVQRWADHMHADTTQGYWERHNGLKRDSTLTAILAARMDKLAKPEDQR